MLPIGLLEPASLLFIIATIVCWSPSDGNPSQLDGRVGWLVTYHASDRAASTACFNKDQAATEQLKVLEG
jgi:hypothetical protein